MPVWLKLSVEELKFNFRDDLPISQLLEKTLTEKIFLENKGN